MSIKLNVTTSYLSVVEMGERNILLTWKDIIIEKYDLDEDLSKELDETLYNSQQTLKLKLNEYSNYDKSLMLAFA